MTTIRMNAAIGARFQSFFKPRDVFLHDGKSLRRFTIGCHGSLGAYFLPPFMNDFMRDAPRIELSLWNGRSSAVWEAVLERDIHFGLIVNAPKTGDELQKVIETAYATPSRVVERLRKLNNP